MNGFSEIRDMQILLTAYRNDSVVAEAKKLNVQGLIEKPFTSDIIMASLAHLIKMRDRYPQRQTSE
jgi:AmiR/NasT family two-component response regulator